ncbi:unnamed product, partial [Ostreococcus tauri]
RAPRSTRAALAGEDERSDSDAPEEVSGARGRAEATRARANARAAVRAAAAAAKTRRPAARSNARARGDDGTETATTTAWTASADDARADEDDLEALPEDVVAGALGDGRRGGEKRRAFDAYEAHVGGKKRVKRSKRERREAKRRTYERDGFEVVALEGARGDETAEPPTAAVDFLRARLMDKHARSGEMLRDTRTGRIPNPFARRR